MGGHVRVPEFYTPYTTRRYDLRVRRLKVKPSSFFVFGGF